MVVVTNVHSHPKTRWRFISFEFHTDLNNLLIKFPNPAGFCRVSRSESRDAAAGFSSPVTNISQRLTVHNNQPEVLEWSWWWRVAQTTSVPTGVGPGQLGDAHIQNWEYSGSFPDIFSSVSADLSCVITRSDQEVFSFTGFPAEELPGSRWERDTWNHDVFPRNSILSQNFKCSDVFNLQPCRK